MHLTFFTQFIRYSNQIHDNGALPRKLTAIAHLAHVKSNTCTHTKIYKRRQMGQAGKQPTKGKSKREPVNICTNGSQFQCLNTKVKRKMTVQKTHISDKTSTSKNKCQL